MGDQARRMGTCETIDGELHTQPRPRPRHALASSALGEILGPPFRRERGGPAGWITLDEPELHLRDDIVVPDLAGWRRERMPRVPDVAFFTLAPDWACEVLSTRTAKIDRPKRASFGDSMLTSRSTRIGFTSLKLGVAVYCPGHDEEPLLPVEGVFVFRSGYDRGS